MIDTQGIKRSLAATAVAALVVTGVPSVASAAAGDPVGKVVINPPDTQTKRPGESTDLFEVTVFGPDNTTPVADKTVTLSIDSGYFTPRGADLTVVPPDQGSTMEVTTDADGKARFKVAIGRDTGFDDDGQVLSTITATSGGVSDTEDQLFDSTNPKNGSAVEIVRSQDADQESTDPRGAESGSQSVSFDVRAFDEFGNPVKGEMVALSSDTDQVVTPEMTTTDLRMNGDVEVYAAEGYAGTATITASWMKTERGSATNTTFTDTAPAAFYDGQAVERAPITVALKGRNNGGKADRLLAKAPAKAAGATVILRQTGLKNRPSRIVAQGTANGFGNVRFVVRDRNGTKYTQYRAFYRRTADTKFAASNRRQVR